MYGVLIVSRGVRKSGVVLFCKTVRLCVNVVRTEDHSSKVVAGQCPICGLASFIRRGGMSLGGWGRHYGMRIGLAFFLFPLFYLSCHYVSSAVFNDCSSLQAVSGCTAVGGGGQWR